MANIQKILLDKDNKGNIKYTVPQSNVVIDWTCYNSNNNGGNNGNNNNGGNVVDGGICGASWVYTAL